MWIDDDGSKGVFVAKQISDSIGIKPVFAVIADRMSQQVTDSLVQWQKQGVGIVLHGLRHDPWKEWNEQQIEEDISKSKKVLQDKGIDTTKLLRIIVPPHGCNTNDIRSAIRKTECQMITGACLINPNRDVFQLGRINISMDTDTTRIRKLLQRAYTSKLFVIFCTHSSMTNHFSADKTRKVLSIAKEIGFNFDISL